MKKFGNTANKINAILSIFREGEKLRGNEIVERVRKRGYRIDEGHIKMFIYYNMLYKYLHKEVIKGVNHYFLIS
jgi:repressor of nif and glnA expression